MARVELKTYGDVKKIINGITKQNIFQNAKGALADEGIGIAVDLLGSVIPGISAAKKTYDIFRAIGKKPDTQKTNTWLDKLDIDDQTAAIVDDTVENGFFQELSNTIARIPDDTPLDPNFDINKRFGEYLKKKYKNHYVAPVTDTKKMKKSELKRIIQEELKGYSKYYPGGQAKGGTSDEFGTILRNIALGTPERGDGENGHKVLDKADPKNVDRILRGEKPVYEEEGEEKKFYSKEEVIDYIKNHPPVKYYRIGVGQGVSRDLRDDAEAAIELVKKSGVNKYKLSRYGQVIQFSLPFDEKHGDLVRSMGSLD